MSERRARMTFQALLCSLVLVLTACGGGGGDGPPGPGRRRGRGGGGGGTGPAFTGFDFALAPATSGVPLALLQEHLGPVQRRDDRRGVGAVSPHARVAGHDPGEDAVPDHRGGPHEVRHQGTAAEVDPPGHVRRHGLRYPVDGANVRLVFDASLGYQPGGGFFANFGTSSLYAAADTTLDNEFCTASAVRLGRRKTRASASTTQGTGPSALARRKWNFGSTTTSSPRSAPPGTPTTTPGAQRRRVLLGRDGGDRRRHRALRRSWATLGATPRVRAERRVRDRPRPDRRPAPRR